MYRQDTFWEHFNLDLDVLSFVLLLNKQDNGSGTAARCNSDEVSAKTMSVAEFVQETILVVGDTKYCT